MSETVLVNLAFPEVGVEYLRETLEAEPPDQLAALELAMHAIGHREVELRTRLGLQLPVEMVSFQNAETWRQLR